MNLQDYLKIKNALTRALVATERRLALVSKPELKRLYHEEARHFDDAIRTLDGIGVDQSAQQTSKREFRDFIHAR